MARGMTASQPRDRNVTSGVTDACARRAGNGTTDEICSAGTSTGSGTPPGSPSRGRPPGGGASTGRTGNAIPSLSATSHCFLSADPVDHALGHNRVPVLTGHVAALRVPEPGVALRVAGHQPYSTLHRRSLAVYCVAQ